MKIYQSIIGRRELIEVENFCHDEDMAEQQVAKYFSNFAEDDWELDEDDFTDEWLYQHNEGKMCLIEIGDGYQIWLIYFCDEIYVWLCKEYTCLDILKAFRWNRIAKNFAELAHYWDFPCTLQECGEEIVDENYEDACLVWTNFSNVEYLSGVFIREENCSWVKFDPLVFDNGMEAKYWAEKNYPNATLDKDYHIVKYQSHHYDG